MALLIALLALLTIIGAAVSIALLTTLDFAWPVLALGGFALLAAILLVLRHRHAEPFLRMVAMVWSPLGLVVLLAYFVGPTDGRSRPEWAEAVLALAFTASVASVVAIYAGFAHLRQSQVRRGMH